MRIATLPTLKTAGWDGDVADIGGLTLVDIVDLEGFAAPQDTDAMAVAYLVPGNDRFPRLNRASLPTLQGLDQEPLLHWVFLDIDNPGHTRWTSLAVATVALALATGAGSVPMGGYTTRAGYRLVAPLDPPLPVSLANSFLSQFGALHSEDARLLHGVTLDIDPASYEWTRLMRLPCAKREGTVLDSVVLLDNLTPIDPHSFGFTLTEQPHEVGDWGDAPPEPALLTWEDWQHSIDMPWTTQGRAVPEDETGSRRFMCRTALARIAARGDYTDPHTLASFLWESVLATTGSSLDIGDLWKMACWVADRQASDVPEDAPAFTEDLPSGAATTAEWATASRALSGRNSRTHASLKDGLPLHSSKAKYVEYTYRTLRTLAEGTELPADSLYRLVKESVEAQQAPYLHEVWAKCQQLAEERSNDTLEGDDRLRRAFIRQFPLTLACPNPGTPLFQLNTSTTPYSYKVTSESLVEYDLERLTKAGLPFDVDYGGMKVRAILRDFGGRVENIAYSSGQEGCRYNKDNSMMNIGTHRRSPCKATYHADVAEWLELIGGGDPKGLKDWLSCVTYTTDQPLCSVYIEGGAGIGKSLLGKGIASLWGSPPVDYNRAMNGEFNQGLIMNPLLFADEGVIVDRNNQSAASLKFRDVVSATSHTIRALYKAPVPLRGAMRVLICANDDRGLPFKDSLGADGIDAIIQRVMYIKADPRARDFLQGIGGRAGLGDHWAPDDNSPGSIAEHILWLRDNHTPSPADGSRFMVVGKETSWHREFGARQGIKPNVLRVIYSYLVGARHGVAATGVRVADDPEKRMVWVHPTTVLDGWDQYAKGYPAKPAHIKDALSQLSTESSVKSIAGKSHRVKGVPYQAFIDAGVCEPDDLG